MLDKKLALFSDNLLPGLLRFGWLYQFAALCHSFCSFDKMYLVPFFWQFFISIKIFLILCTSCLCQHYIVFFKQLWRKIKQNDVRFLHPFLHLYFGHMMSFFFSYVFRTCQVPTKDHLRIYCCGQAPKKDKRFLMW